MALNAQQEKLFEEIMRAIEKSKAFRPGAITPAVKAKFKEDLERSCALVKGLSIDEVLADKARVMASFVTFMTNRAMLPHMLELLYKPENMIGKTPHELGELKKFTDTITLIFETSKIPAIRSAVAAVTAQCEDDIMTLRQGHLPRPVPQPNPREQEDLLTRAIGTHLGFIAAEAGEVTETDSDVYQAGDDALTSRLGNTFEAEEKPLEEQEEADALLAQVQLETEIKEREEYRRPTPLPKRPEPK